VKYLIDTHTYIWYINGDKRLSYKSLEIIDNIKNEICISIVSLWEISIKMKLDKLKVYSNIYSIEKDLIHYKISILPITLIDIIKNYELPFHHRDPFDRMLISQSITQNIPIIGCDTIFDKYFDRRIW
jgi:PIN domain nuclease of toxin-antitoxin system